MPSLLAAFLLTALPQEPRLDRLVRRMGAEKYEVREAATAALYKAGRRAVPALQRATESRDPEIAARARFLLKILPALPIRPGDVTPPPPPPPVPLPPRPPSAQSR